MDFGTWVTESHHSVAKVGKQVDLRLRYLYKPLTTALTGGIAQLGERLLCKQDVEGSNPFTSTIMGSWSSG